MGSGSSMFMSSSQYLKDILNGWWKGCPSLHACSYWFGKLERFHPTFCNNCNIHPQQSFNVKITTNQTKSYYEIIESIIFSALFFHIRWCFQVFVHVHPYFTKWSNFTSIYLSNSPARRRSHQPKWWPRNPPLRQVHRCFGKRVGNVLGCFGKMIS